MVFGGTGMVGSAIAAEAVRRGLSVTCVTRGGAPPAHIASSEWGGAVRWLRGDALEPDTYRDAMRHHDAVVTSVGRLPLPSLTHEEVVRDNGETNIIPGRVARELGVPRLVVVGASIPAFVPGMAFGFSPSRGVFRAGYARRQGSRRGVRQGRIRGCRGYRKGCRGIRSGRLETGRRVRDATRGRRRPPAVDRDGAASAALRHIPVDAVAPLAPVPATNVARAAVAAATEEKYAAKFTVIDNLALLRELYDRG